MRAIVNARVLPMTEPYAEATAVAWADQVAAVGSDEEIRRVAAAAGTDVEDGGGRIILPGFVDAHMHFLHVGLKRIRPDLRGATSREEALERLARWLDTHPGTDQVIGEGWDESDWPGRQPFHRTEIDAVCGDRPVVLRRICGHVAVANSAALPAIQARWDDPALVDAATGRLLEAPSLYLNEVLPATPDQLAAAVEEATRVAHALGVVALGDYEQAPLRAALVHAARQERLGVRISCSIYLQDLEKSVADGFRTGRQVGPMLFDGGLKLFLDGSIGGHTARMLAPYEDHPGLGMANHEDDALDAAMETAYSAGVQIHAHAIGDGAIEQGLEAFERLARRHRESPSAASITLDRQPAPQSDGERAPRPANGQRASLSHGEQASRPEEGEQPSLTVVAGRSGPDGAVMLAHRFEHYEIAHDAQIARTAALGLWASSQPNFVGEWSGAGGMYEQRIGRRFRLNNRFRSILDGGVRLAFGSDGMPFGPLFGIRCAVEHPDPEQRLDAREAIWHYTHEAAAALGQPTWGSLRPGHEADILILDQPDLDAPADQWVVRETIVAGQTVHRGSRPCPTDDDVE